VELAPNVRIALHFTGCDALQFAHGKCVGGAWLIVDRKWGAGARWPFLQRLGKGKAMTSLPGGGCCSFALWSGVSGVNAKKVHTRGSDESGASQRPKIRVAISINRVPYRL
jgi:hypothetical protein